ncbi:GGDEF domain-containing protein [Halarcobacter bivalviorum]|uniref:GGDEF domain-containing protein n=1 Tax=Halarcobacter bivalviorum TaxID=663364 RepID=UPI00100B4913|nr:GGDEF domain-containing protein [Halarcobacter bivalviorum]RXK07807.1 GGDEF domain-containing protein [Halarcobacter bivalviorum]
MKKEFYKSVSFKLGVLSFIILASLFIASFMFNSQIDKLKKQIDYIYFGNYIPVLKLHTIEENYSDLIKCMRTYKKCEREPYFKSIKKDWDYYNNSYKDIEERKVVNKIDKEVKASLNYKAKISTYKSVIKKIDFLKEYEKNIAYKKRVKFLKEYSSMKEYLFYNMIALITVSFLFISFIIYSIIKKDNQLKILTKKYAIESITDSMTKLYNRKYFDKIFDNMPFISNQNSWHTAFIMIDIDFFKQYNDTYGHDMGDETLKAVASELKAYFNKDYEYVFRLGGEEFGVILFDIDEDILKECLNDINKNIQSLNIEHKNSKISNVVTISIGAVIYKPYSYVSCNKLYKVADECLYKSKENGRNQFTIYNEGE